MFMVKISKSINKWDQMENNNKAKQNTQRQKTPPLLITSSLSASPLHLSSTLLALGPFLLPTSALEPILRHPLFWESPFYPRSWTRSQSTSVATSFSSGLAGFSKDRDSVPSTQPHLAQRKDTADTHRMSSGVTGGDCDHSQFPTLSLSQLSVPNPGESVWCHKRLWG